MAVDPPEWPSVTRRMARDRLRRQLLGLAVLIAAGVGVAVAIGGGKSSGKIDSAFSSAATSTRTAAPAGPAPKTHQRTPSQRAQAPIARVVRVPKQCAAVTVSAVDPTYAAYSYRTGVGCSEVSIDAVTILRHGG